MEPEQRRSEEPREPGGARSKPGVRTEERVGGFNCGGRAGRAPRSTAGLPAGALRDLAGARPHTNMSRQDPGLDL